VSPEPIPPVDSALAKVYAYHQRTKHDFGHYAKGPGFLDWDTQPNPFRRFAGAPEIPLPLTAARQPVLYADLFEPGGVPPQPSNLAGVGALLELSMGLAAWKQYGPDRWALRCNPSSGNLHPTEAYLVASGVAGLADGVYHYASHDHLLERRCRADFPFPCLLIGFSSVYWREAWKYGERAYRYCQHDVGHALGALRYAAAVLGWRVRLLDDWGDEAVAALLGLDRSGDFAAAETEAPDLLCLIEIEPEETTELPVVEAWVDAARSSEWVGLANALSGRHQHDWPVIEEVHEAASKPPTESAGWRPPPTAPLPRIVCEHSAAALIKQRRSAQAFDGVTSIPAKTLFRLLDATLPRANAPPFDLWRWPPRVHLLLFVHRVEGMSPGLYLFCRREGIHSEFREAFRADFAWDAVAACPKHLAFYRLVRTNAQEAAKALSCHQEIAGDGVFSLGMLAELDAALAEGPWVYRRLFWECGLIGQALYLEAEAAGVRGTGIGCFFDDPVHELLSLESTRFQSLYHFTIGGALVDQRLQTLPAYGHLGERS